MWGARDVAGNMIGASGGAKVAEALTMNTTLTHLGLGCEEGWGDAGVYGWGDGGRCGGGHGAGEGMEMGEWCMGIRVFNNGAGMML